MVGAGLAASLVEALQTGTHLLWSGDFCQLPPVEHGAPLRDMIAAGLPYGELTEIHRNEGDIVRACRALKEGRPFIPSPCINLAAGQNLKHIEASRTSQALGALAHLLRNVPPDINPVWDVQVLCAVNENSGVGRKNLNEGMQRILNPDGARVEGMAFRLNDKVICSTNGLLPLVKCPGCGNDVAELVAWNGKWFECGSDGCFNQWKPGECDGDFVANGEIGKVVLLDKKLMHVAFDSPRRTVRVAGEWLQQFELAYAVTCHKCIHPDTLVETTEGLLPIREIKPTGKIATPFGPQQYRNFVRNPIQNVLQIRTRDGYEITVSPDHKCEVWRSGGLEMIEASQLVSGDTVRLKLGATVEPSCPAKLPACPPGDVRARVYDVPAEVDARVAEFFGLMVGDGTVFRSGFSLHKQHPEVVDRFRALGQRLFGIKGSQSSNEGTPGWLFSSTILRDWLKLVGGMSPNKKAVPKCILQSSSRIHAAFLKGLFEDVTVNVKGDQLDHIEWSSCYPDMVRTVRVMLLRLGIISGCVKGSPERLYIYGVNAARFCESVGFISYMKQGRLLLPHGKETRYRVPVLKSEVPKWHHLKGFSEFDYQNARAMGFVTREVAARLAAVGVEWAKERLNWHYTKIESIVPSQSETMCVEVPDGHRFLQAGFPWGNSQGSQWPVVIIMADDSNGADRVTSFEWFRTAISRAEKLCCTIGKKSAIDRQCRKSALKERKTFLAQLLKGVA